MREAVTEVQGSPEPKDLQGHGLTQMLELLADGADAPRAIPRTRHLRRIDAQLISVDGDSPLPGTPLGKAGVVREQDAFWGSTLLSRLLDSDSRRTERQVATNFML